MTIFKSIVATILESSKEDLKHATVIADFMDEWLTYGDLPKNKLIMLKAHAKSLRKMPVNTESDRVVNNAIGKMRDEGLTTIAAWNAPYLSLLATKELLRRRKN